MVAIFNPLYTGNPRTGTLENSEDTDEMLHFIWVDTFCYELINLQVQKNIIIY